MAAAKQKNNFNSKVFADLLRTVDIAGTSETVMYGGDRNFDLLKKAFKDIKVISVIGWSSQGPAQARNLRESIQAADLDIEVTIGLRIKSKSRSEAKKHGFRVETPEEAVKKADMSLLLIADAGLVEDGQRLIKLAPKGATIGFSHGFFLGHLKATGQKLRKDVDVVGVCPKGMGPSVRRLYEQGSGINASFAVEQGGAKARDRALGWALAIGSPYTFQTTLESEWKSDVFGERAILLGGVHGIVEALYAWKRQFGTKGEKAYLEVVESLVGQISKTISHEGLANLYDKLSKSDQNKFKRAYNAAYPQLSELINKIYTDVSSSRELEEVVSDNANNVPMTNIDGTEMWRDGEKVRAKLDVHSRAKKAGIDPEVAGVYAAGMVAQVDVLRKNGHYWSEVVNESIIEAVDSLNPYMRARGVAFMVDNCSTTARRGSRKWAPQFQAWLAQGVMPVIDGDAKPSDKHDYLGDFKKHSVHKALKVLGEMRPPVDIAVS